MTTDSQAATTPGNEAAQDHAAVRDSEGTQVAVSTAQRQHYEVIKGNPDGTALRALDEVFQSVADRAAEAQAGKKPNSRGRYGLPTPGQRGRTGAPLHPNPAAFRNS